MLKFFVDKIDTVDPYKLTKVICKQVSSSQKIKLKLRDLTALWGITKDGPRVLVLKPPHVLLENGLLGP